MNAALKLALFGVLLIAVFMAALGIGAAVGPLDDGPPPVHSGHLR